MDYETIIETNFAVLISVVGTLLGVLIGIGGGILKDCLSRKSDYDNQKLDWRRDYRDRYVVVP